MCQLASGNGAGLWAVLPLKRLWEGGRFAAALNPEDLRDEPTTSVAARKEEEGMEAALEQVRRLSNCGEPSS